MISIEKILSIPKSDLQEVSKVLNKDDIPQLVEWLSLKDNNIRYQAILLLQSRSIFFDDVYPFWDTFRDKLKSENSYQRSIGVMLIAESARWDRENKLDDIMDKYFTILNDEKPITIRQCIQSLGRIVPYKAHLHMEIAHKLMSINITEIRETMRKLILLDILSVLSAIRRYKTNDDIEGYILHAITGGLLDKKSIKQVESMLKEQGGAI
jgi:hypothetical protein